VRVFTDCDSDDHHVEGNRDDRRELGDWKSVIVLKMYVVSDYHVYQQERTTARAEGSGYCSKESYGVQNSRVHHNAHDTCGHDLRSARGRDIALDFPDTVRE
jgi:hypothetical protein